MTSSGRSVPTEDRISALPDSLICHILSFLPTKLAVATSILSKRWKPQWKSFLTIYVQEDDFQDFNDFRHFVYSVFVFRDAMLPLRSFCIRCTKYYNYDPLENFELEGCDYYLHNTKETVPGLLRVFSCKTLVVIKLQNLTIDDVPHFVDFPLLKTLHLVWIYFRCNFVHFMNLVPGCPILKDFHTQFLKVDNLCQEEFKGFPELVRANLSCSEDNFLFAWLFNAKFLRVELEQTTFVYRVPTFLNLTHMELSFDSDSCPWKWKFLTQVIQHCPNLQNFTIEESYDILPTVNRDWTEPETSPKCLSSKLRKCSLIACGGLESELQFAEYILLNSKLLRTMIVKSNRRLDADEKLQMLVKLSSYPRSSAKCKLLFD